MAFQPSTEPTSWGFQAFISLYDKTLPNDPNVWSQSFKNITKSEGLTIIITSSRSTRKKERQPMTSLLSQRDRGLRWAGWSLGCCLADVTDVTPIWVALDSHFFLMMRRDFSQQQTTLPFFNCQLDIFPTTSNQCSSSVDAQDPPRNVAEAVDPPCHLPIIPKKTTDH